MYALSRGLCVVHMHRLKEGWQYTAREAPPARMGRAHQAAIRTRDKHRQAVGHQNCTGQSRLGREAGIGLGGGVTVCVFFNGDNPCAVDLREP